MTLTNALNAYRWLYVGFIVVASAQTVVDAHRHPGGRFATGLVLLGSVEILAALFFLFHQTQLVGATMLLLVFVVAAVLTASQGQLPVRFLYYAGTAVFIVYLDRHLPSR